MVDDPLARAALSAATAGIVLARAGAALTLAVQRRSAA
jgi:hypothetical protein